MPRKTSWETGRAARAWLSLPALLTALAGPGHAGESSLSSLLREPPAAAAQAAVRALPVAAQTELFTLYAHYSDMVSQRLDQGWRAGLLRPETAGSSQEDTLPARQVEDAIRSRQAELETLDRKLDQASSDEEAPLRRQRERAQARLAALREAQGRDKGTCSDWSDLLWAELGRLRPAYWSIQDRQRQARPFHTGAVLCSRSAASPAEVCSETADRCSATGPRVCLVFDPWQRGEADVYALGAWDQGGFAGRLPAEFFLHELPEPPRASKGRR